MAVSLEAQSDAQFCDQIVELIDGTHWAQGQLHTFCWVPVVGELPAGAQTATKWEFTSDYDGTLYADVKPSDYPSREVVCWRKSEWCLVGIVMQVAALPTDDERHIEEHEQSLRIIKRLWEQLPESEQSDNIEAAVDRLGREIGDLESWNDHQATTKALVRALVIRARDAALTERIADGGS
jgi:hypothetical protein